jgi:catechol 2,3-dioxygenase-like lactoylglutathione lyase family enzyme
MLNLRHVGIVVTDLDAAMKELTDTIGATWSEPSAVEYGGGRRTKSTGLSPQIELIEGEGLGTTPGFVGVHHFSVWVSDLRAAAERMESSGATRLLWRDEPLPADGTVMYRTPSGILMEISTKVP